MKYNQNEKIMQITEQTLVIGVDVASDTHYARAFDFRGIEFGKVIRFSNTAEGFAAFASWAKEVQDSYQKPSVVVGMEPTGHYWFNFAQHLGDQSMQLVLVNPFHVKRSKELDDNNPTKHDRKDPKTIAMLVKDGRYMVPYIPEGIYSELRGLMDIRWNIVQKLNSIRNQVKRWLSIYFPEFNQVFGNWEGKAALIVLQEFPTPTKVLTRGIEGIVGRWRQDKIKAVGIKRATELVRLAQASIGLREGATAGEHALEVLLEQYNLLISQYERTMAIVEQLAMKIPGVDKLLQIKGIGLIIAAGFLAQVGDINRFEHPKQIQKLAGLNLKENSSGKHKGKTTISKRGRSRLRALLFQGIMPLVANNPEFQELHKHYTTRSDNPLRKKQSLIVLCCKLIRVFYGLLTKNVDYDSQRMMRDIRRPVLQKAA